MPRSAPTLLEAMERNRLLGEDLLTEVLATTLRIDHELADRLCGLAELEISPTTAYEVSTQAWVAPDLRVDMLVTVFTNGRAERCWFENKTDSDFRPAQLSDYATATGRSGVAIVSERQDVDDDPRWSKVTWSMLGLILDDLGRSHAGRAWRHLAAGPEAGAVQRARHELLSFLERRHEVTIPQALSHLDVLAIGRSEVAWSNVARLFELMAANVAAEHPSLAPRTPGDWGGEGYYLDFSHASWANDNDPDNDDRHATVFLSTGDGWRGGDRFDEPAFAAGYWYKRRHRRISWPAGLDFLSATPEIDAWRAKAKPHGIAITTEGDNGLLCATRYLGELPTLGATLEEQARVIADWAVAAIRRIDALGPPGAS